MRVVISAPLDALATAADRMAAFCARHSVAAAAAAASGAEDGVTSALSALPLTATTTTTTTTANGGGDPEGVTGPSHPLKRVVVLMAGEGGRQRPSASFASVGGPEGDAGASSGSDEDGHHRHHALGDGGGEAAVTGSGSASSDGTAASPAASAASSGGVASDVGGAASGSVGALVTPRKSTAPLHPQSKEHLLRSLEMFSPPPTVTTPAR